VQQVESSSDKLIYGKNVAAEIDRRTIADRAQLDRAGIVPCLAVLHLGEHDDAASYRRVIEQRAKRVGVLVSDTGLPQEATRDVLLATLAQLNADPLVHAILVQNPLPAPFRQVIGRELSIDKDVEGLSPANIGKLLFDQPAVTPCTPGAIVALIESRVPSLIGKRIVIINRSATVGRPLSQLLLNRRATVTVCSTATVDLPGEARRAEILVVAIGKPRAVGLDYIGDGAVVVDVGINAEPSGQGICGDVDTEAVMDRVSAITPVPGGVGPVTTAVLLANVVYLARLTSSTAVQAR
jgi:methylenetetrahydrofolate dehydrogenase (NADP+)/methenyltetrahydrofolate cyclohydrolase